VRLPEYYDRKFIHYEWMRGWVMADDALAVAATTCAWSRSSRSSRSIIRSTSSSGPDGSLYVLEYGTYWNAKNRTRA
jgi:cytochrome c